MTELLNGNFEYEKPLWEPKRKESYYGPREVCREIQRTYWNHDTSDYPLKVLGMACYAKAETEKHIVEKLGE